MSTGAPPMISRSLARRLLRAQHRRDGATGLVTVVDSRSMAPLIQANVTAEVDWAASNPSLRPGALILASTAGDLLVVHRALAARVGPRGPQLLQMADNVEFGNPYAAAWVDDVQLLGAIRRLHEAHGSVLYDADSRFWRTVDRVMARTGRRLWRLSRHELSLPASALRFGRLAFMHAARQAWQASDRLARNRHDQEARHARL